MKKLSDKKIPDDYTTEPDDAEDDYAREMTLKPTTADEPKNFSEPRPKTFHSKHAVPVDENFSADIPKRKKKFSPAETSGVTISAVMLIYSLSTGDTPLFFLSAALMIFLLRPLIGALFGKNSRAVQNALHAFSIVLFVGALLMLFL